MGGMWGHTEPWQRGDQGNVGIRDRAWGAHRDMGSWRDVEGRGVVGSSEIRRCGIRGGLGVMETPTLPVMGYISG